MRAGNQCGVALPPTGFRGSVNDAMVAGNQCGVTLPPTGFRMPPGQPRPAPGNPSRPLASHNQPQPQSLAHYRD